MPSSLAEQRTGWSLMIFCARATRGLRRPSLDARNGRSLRPLPKERTSKLGESIYIVRCAQSRAASATPLKRGSGKTLNRKTPTLALCSRNARPQKTLVGRAHDGNPPGHPLGEERRAEAATAGKHSRSLCFSQSYRWRLKRRGFEQLPSQSRSQRPLSTKPARSSASKPSKSQPAEINSSLSLNQKIEKYSYRSL